MPGSHRSPRLGLRAQAALVALASLAAVYACAEGVYRFYRYGQLKDQSVLPRVRVIEAPLVRFDAELGFRYIANTTTRHFALDAANRITHENTVRVNNLGHVSPRADFVEKPADEFRVALLGDSFTACIFNNVPWSVVLEDRLNEDPALLAAVGKARVKVMNFGMGATGFVQWPATYDHEVARFRPDLTIIAFIEHDIWRDFKWMDTVELCPGAGYSVVLVSPSLPVRLENPRVMLGQQIVLSPEAARSAEARSRVLQDLLDRRLKAMPWWSPHPELLGVAWDASGVPLPDILTPRFSYRPDAVSRWGSGRRLEATVEAMRSLALKGPALFVHLPTRSELASGRPTPLLERLGFRLPDLDLATVQHRLPYRPTDALLDRWFLADNGHLTDAGAVAYGDGMATLVRAYLGRSLRTPTGPPASSTSYTSTP